MFSFLGAFTEARPRGVRLPHSVARARAGGTRPGPGYKAILADGHRFPQFLRNV